MTSKSGMMRTHPDFQKLVDDMSKRISEDIGLDKSKSKRSRKISSTVVTKKIAKLMKKTFDKGL